MKTVFETKLGSWWRKLPVYNLITDSMDQGPSSETKSRSLVKYLRQFKEVVFIQEKIIL